MARVLSLAGMEKPGMSVTGQSVSLTDREREVLQSVAQGQRSKEVAFHLGISERTVKAHLASIYEKLGVDSRAAAVTMAIQRGILKN